MTEELRWGSPTATPPFEPFVQPVPELAEGALRRLRQLRVCGVPLALTENDGGGS